MTISKRKIKTYIKFLENELKEILKEAEGLEYEAMEENKEKVIELKGKISSAYYILNNY